MKLSRDRCKALEAYLDGRLGHDVRALFEAHLTRCEACSLDVEEWRTIRQVYGDWSKTAILVDFEKPVGIGSKAFVAAVLEKMAKEGPTAKKAKINAPKRYLFAAAAAVVSVFLAGYIFITGHSSSQHNRLTDPTTAPLSSESSPPPDALQPLIPATPTAQLRTVTSSPEGPVPGRVLSAPRGGQFTLSIMSDSVGVDESSAVQIVDVSVERTVFRMIKGTVAFDVAPRPAGSRFLVTAGSISIEVIGTRFGVTMRDTETVTVFVDEGTVAVSSSNERILLHAGSSITLTEGDASPVTEMEPREEELLDELLSGETAAGRYDTDDTGLSYSPDAAVSDRRPPLNRRMRASAHKDIEAWRALILDGEVKKAETRIKSYLRRNPRDMEAAMLSAVCEKKQGRYGEAAETYKRVAASGNTKYANTARYLAAELKQSRLGHFQEARELLDDYLVNAPKSAPNRAEARFRKAECLLAMGESARAGRILTELIEDYGRAPIANRARTLRESIDMGRDPMR